MMQICPSETCFGCSACADICPKGAVSMEIKTGFYRPVIDAERCMKCGKCQKVCQACNMQVLNDLNLETTCFAAYSKDPVTHFQCTSGGFCTELSRQYVAAGKSVIGAWWNPEKQMVEHRICSNKEDIDLIAKSKYVQSSLTGVYQQIKKSDPDIEYLFIGVPCQVNAMKRFFQKSSRRIAYIDLLCHGGSSPLCMGEHIQNVSKGKKVSDISFRGGEDDCNFVVKSTNKTIYRCGQFDDPYFYAFMKRLIYQPVCYQCPFAGTERPGDLTIGDFWGLREELMPKEGGNGVNMVLVNTDRGQQMLETLTERVIFEQVPAAEAIVENDTLREPTHLPENYHELNQRIQQQGFRKALDLIEKDFYENRVRKANIQFMKLRLKRVFVK